jgi:hypothetical protein
MIIVSVDTASVPVGATRPGEFLLGSDGPLHHITAAAGTVDDAAAYQAAGIDGR